MRKKKSILFWKTILFKIKWFFTIGILTEKSNGTLRISKIIDGKYYYKYYK